MWDILGPVIAAFLIGVARGMTVCLMLCAPGLIPLILAEKAGMARSLLLGFLLSLPRILLLTLLGAVLGYLSFELLRQGAVTGTLKAISAGSYIVLGLLLVFIGIQLLRVYDRTNDDDEDGNTNINMGKEPLNKIKGDAKGHVRRDGRKDGRKVKAVSTDEGAAKTCADKQSWWQRMIFSAAKRVYPAKGKSQKLFLVWGGLLSLACVGEISGEAGLLAVMATNTAAGNGTIDPALGTGMGAFIMFIFSLGATLPIMITAAVGGGITKKVKDKETLATIRGACAFLMVGLGFYFLVKEIQIILTLAKVL